MTFRWAVALLDGQSAHRIPVLLLMVALTGLYAVGAALTTSLILNRARRDAILELS
jgi:hypothetical protein